jgi:hypothetical protein
MRRIGLLSLLLSTSVLAQAPTQLGYQGRLLRADGAAATGIVEMTFRLHEGSTGGTPLWSETQLVPLSQGFYSLYLGSVNPLSPALLDRPEVFLQVSVGGEALLPRQKVGSVAYALRATVARDVSGGTVDATSISVGGQTVIGPDGRLTGPAADSSGTVTEVTGVSPIFVANGTTTPAISIASATAASLGVAQAGAGLGVSSGVLSVSYGTTAGTAAQGNDPRLFDARPPTGAAGADLAGSYPNPTVARLQGRAVAATAPTLNQVLKWNGSAWAPGADQSTAYSAGDGLTLSGTTFSLLQSCGAGQVLKWSGTAWACAADADTVTTYSAGSGLALSGTTFSLLPGCAAGQVPKWNGTAWACAADVNTTYSAGSGLALSGTTFSLLPGCTAGQIPKWSGTAWACAADVDTNSGGTVTSVSGIAPLSVANGSTTPAISIASATTSTQGVVQAGTGLGVSAGTLSVIYGTTAGSAAQGNDSRLWDARTPTGTAGGDLAGTYPSPSVARLQGRAVATTAPATNQVLKWNGSAWAPAADEVGVSSFNARTGAVSLTSADVTGALGYAPVSRTGDTMTGNLRIDGSGMAGDIGLTLRKVGFGSAIIAVPSWMGQTEPSVTTSLLNSNNAVVAASSFGYGLNYNAGAVLSVVNVANNYGWSFRARPDGRFVVFNQNTAHQPLTIDDSTGRVAINAESANGYRLYVNGNTYTIGLVNASDARLKKEIRPVTQSLDRITSLTAYNYRWIDEENYGSDLRLGLLAQEVERAFPEAVKTGTDGYMAVDYSALVAPVIESIKDLHGSLAAAEDQILELERRNAELERRLELQGRAICRLLPADPACLEARR